MLNILLQATPSTDGGGFEQYFQLFFFGAIILVFYFFMIRPQRRRMREQQELQRSIQVGDEVVDASVVARLGQLHRQLAG